METKAVILAKVMGSDLRTSSHELELVKARGKQRTDATHVLAAIRVMNRLEQIAETMCAALNELAAEAPIWLQKTTTQSAPG